MPWAGPDAFERSLSARKLKESSIPFRFRSGWQPQSFAMGTRAASANLRFRQREFTSWAGLPNCARLMSRKGMTSNSLITRTHASRGRRGLICNPIGTTAHPKGFRPSVVPIVTGGIMRKATLPWLATLSLGTCLLALPTSADSSNSGGNPTPTVQSTVSRDKEFEDGESPEDRLKFELLVLQDEKHHYDPQQKVRRRPLGPIWPCKNSFPPQPRAQPHLASPQPRPPAFNPPVGRPWDPATSAVVPGPF